MDIFRYIKKTKNDENPSNTKSNNRKGKDNYNTKLRSISASRIPTSGTEAILMHNRSCQTILIEQQQPPQPSPRTSQPPAHLQMAQKDSAWTTSSTDAPTPTHADIAAKSKTITALAPNPTGASSVDEYFFFRQSRRTQPDRDIGYEQFSEYKVDARGRSIEKINSYLDISDSSKQQQQLTGSHHHASFQQIPAPNSRKPQPPQTGIHHHHQHVVDIRDLKRTGRALDKKRKPGKLSQSTIETTSVVDNKTSVQGITVKDSSPDKFTIHIVNPNGYESIMKHENVPISPRKSQQQQAAGETNNTNKNVLLNSNFNNSSRFIFMSLVDIAKI